MKVELRTSCASRSSSYPCSSSPGWTGSCFVTRRSKECHCDKAFPIAPAQSGRGNGASADLCFAKLPIASSSYFGVRGPQISTDKSSEGIPSENWSDHSPVYEEFRQEKDEKNRGLAGTHVVLFQGILYGQACLVFSNFPFSSFSHFVFSFFFFCADVFEEEIRKDQDCSAEN